MKTNILTVSLCLAMLTAAMTLSGCAKTNSSSVSASAASAPSADPYDVLKSDLDKDCQTLNNQLQGVADSTLIAHLNTTLDELDRLESAYKLFRSMATTAEQADSTATDYATGVSDAYTTYQMLGRRVMPAAQAVQNTRAAMREANADRLKADPDVARLTQPLVNLIALFQRTKQVIDPVFAQASALLGAEIGAGKADADDVTEERTMQELTKASKQVLDAKMEDQK